MTRVVLDATPLVGVRTGIGVSVAGMLAGLRSQPDPPDVAAFVLGRRHAPDLPARRVPLPTRYALSWWAHGRGPAVDRLLPAGDVVHATNFVVPPLHRPVLITVHDLTFLTHPDTVAPHTAAFAPMLRHAVDRGAHLHTATAATAAEVEALLAPGLGAAGRLHIVPFGVPPLDPAARQLPAGLAAGPPYVLCLGRVELRKNVPLLVEAVARVPGLRLVVAGPDGSASGALAAARAAHPAADVVVLGWVDGPHAAALVRGARAVAYPSSVEGYGFPALQAMAAGTPVLASDTPQLAEVVDGGAQLLPVGDIDAWAGALAALLIDPAAAAAQVGRGRARAAALTWERTGAGLLEAYTRCAGQSPAR